MGTRVALKVSICASGIVAMSSASAVPLTIDFTDSRWSGVTGQTSYTQTYGSLDVTLTSAESALTFNSDGSQAGPDWLALNGDGIGIVDDEISSVGRESIDVRFGSGVTILGYYLLDLFTGEGPDGAAEMGIATFKTIGPDIEFFDLGTATDGVGFYSRTGLSLADTTAISFSAGLQSYSDFALAGILVDLEPVGVPEPGTFGLLGLGLVGFASARWRREPRVCAR